MRHASKKRLKYVTKIVTRSGKRKFENVLFLNTISKKKKMKKKRYRASNSVRCSIRFFKLNQFNSRFSFVEYLPAAVSHHTNTVCIAGYNCSKKRSGIFVLGIFVVSSVHVGICASQHQPQGFVGFAFKRSLVQLSFSLEVTVVPRTAYGQGTTRPSAQKCIIALRSYFGSGQTIFRAHFHTTKRSLKKQIL